MNKSQREIKPPVIRILADSFFHQLHCFVRLAGAVRRLLRKEYRAILVCNDDVRIQVSSDIQQWIEKIVTLRVLYVLCAEILYSPGPVDVGQQPGVSKAKPLDGFAGRQVQ